MNELIISCEAFMDYCDSLYIENDVYAAVESTFMQFDIALENKLIDGAKKALKSICSSLYRKCDNLYRKCKDKESKIAKQLDRLRDFFYKHSNSVEEITDENILEEEKEKINYMKENLRKTEEVFDAEYRDVPKVKMITANT